MERGDSDSQSEKEQVEITTSALVATECCSQEGEMGRESTAEVTRCKGQWLWTPESAIAVGLAKCHQLSESQFPCL